MAAFGWPFLYACKIIYFWGMELDGMRAYLRYNHVGYACRAPKYFYIAVNEGEPFEVGADNHALAEGAFSFSEKDVDIVSGPKFQIVSEADEVVFEGHLAYRGPCKYSGETLLVGDFSEYSKPGRYKIRCGTDSHFFEISDGWLVSQLDANIKSFYYQRSGVELKPETAGKWARPLAHIDSQLPFHYSMNREGTWNAHGGWYDAGDYGKYIVNGGVSVASLMLALELGSPVISKSLDALREEVRFELEFFLRMQDDDGGVFFKVSPERWDTFVTPTVSDHSQKRQIVGKSTTSSLNFCAALAQAHRIFAESDPAFAKKCVSAAIRAYRWALENPDEGFPPYTEGSGPYGDVRVSDEFFWARAMLFREMGQVDLQDCIDVHDQLYQDLADMPPRADINWHDTENLGYMALALQNRDIELRDRARIALEHESDKIVALSADDAYRIALQYFPWGSNGVLANYALTLLVTNTWANMPEYVRCAYGHLDFIYGCNPVNVSFVTGSAWSSPKFPHHRISASDGIAEPVPGLLVGGINQDRQDVRLGMRYPSNLPGLGYVDNQASFASNEVAINWSAPLTASLALLCNEI